MKLLALEYINDCDFNMKKLLFGRYHLGCILEIGCREYRLSFWLKGNIGETIHIILKIDNMNYIFRYD